MRAAAILLGAALVATSAYAQGSRKDDVVLGPTGHPIAGATIRVCQNNVSDTPCAELATIYTDATLTVASPNPFQADGMGNYHFYAPVGRYQVQISGPGIAGAVIYNDTILPPDNAGTGTPGGSDTQVQINKSGALGAATGFALDSSTAPTKLTVPFNVSVKGPQPRIDITAYGAKGDGATDDTAAIQAAINAACSGTGVAGDIFFPPHPGSWYKVSQPQTPSTAPVFTIPLNCRELHFVGGESEIGGQGLQFDMSPTVKIQVTDGASPNAAPVFLLQGGTSANGDTYGGQNSTIENLMIQGHNEAVELQDTGIIHLKNVCLATDATTGQTDNTPLKIENTIWVWWQGGCAEADNISTPDGTQPVVLFDEANLTHNVPPSEIYFSDLIFSGGGMQWNSRVTLGQQSGTSGQVVLRNIVLENTKTDFLAISAQSGDTNAPAYNWEFDNIQIADAGTVTNCILSNSDGGLHAVGFSFTGIWNPLSGCVVKDSASSGGVGHFAHLTIHDSTSYGYVDGSGNSLPYKNDQGEEQDVVANTQTADWMNNAVSDHPNGYGTGLRLFAGSSQYATAEVGPSALLLGSGLEGSSASPYGYSAELGASGSSPLQIAFPKTFPPVSVTASATTGGTLAAGTYYYWVQSCADAACSQASAPSSFASVTISGANNAATISWSAPGLTGTTAVGYYRVSRNTQALFNTYSGGSLSSIIVTAPTTSVLDTGSNLGCCMTSPGVNTMAAALNLGASSMTPATSGSYALGSASLPFGASYFSGMTLTGIVGSTQCLHVNSSGTISGTGSDCGSGGGGSTTVNSQTCALGSSCTIPFQANGTNLISQAGLNFENSAATNGLTLTFSNPSSNNVQLGLSGTLGNAGLTNSSTTPNGITCTLGATCNVGSLFDTNGNASLKTITTASAVDQVSVTNAATANPATVTISATGTDTNINLNLVPKGTGTVECNGASCGSGGGTPGGAAGNLQFNSAGAFAGAASTVVLNHGANVLPATLAASTVYYLTDNSADYTFTSGVAASNNGSTIWCLPGVVLQLQTTGALLAVSGSNTTIYGCTFDGDALNNNFVTQTGGNENLYDHVSAQNVGSAPTVAVIHITGGNNTRILAPHFGTQATAITDSGVDVVTSTGTTINGVSVLNGFFNANMGTLSGPIDVIRVEDDGGGNIEQVKVEGNLILFAGTNAGGLSRHSNIAVNFSSNSPDSWANNTLFATGRIDHCGHWFGIDNSGFANDWCYINGQVFSAGWDFGDAYGDTWSGGGVSAGNSANGFGKVFELIDYGHDVVQGLYVDGVNANTPGVLMTTIGGVGQDTTMDATCRFQAGQAGNCFELQSNDSSTATQNNLIIPHVIGDGTSGQVGVALVDSSGTFTNNRIGAGVLTNVATGVSVGASVSNTWIDPQMYTSVTTPVSDSGTGTYMAPHSYSLSVALVSGTKTVTIPAAGAFTSTSTFNCNTNDTTTITNASKAVPATASTVTVTGTGTDTISGICTGY